MTDLNKINFMSKTRFDNLSAINDDELYAVKTDIAEKEWVINYFNIILSSIYPVGSIYISEQSTCPIQELISGSVWEKIEGKYLLASGELVEATENYSAGDTVEAGLPNITGQDALQWNGEYTGQVCNGSNRNGALAATRISLGAGTESANSSHGAIGVETQYGIAMDASLSSPIYGSSTTVRPPAFVVNVWKRTA